MSVDFEAWANQVRATRCYLVELTFLKKADLSTVTLYLSTHPYPDAARRRGIVVDKPYAACVKGIPRLTRTAGSILQPDRMPSWGELEILTKPDYKPDLGRSISWSTLLSGAYTAWGQTVTIRLGDPSWDYADFLIIFSGYCANLVHDDLTTTLTVVDKSTDFSRKYPDYELPANDQVVESNWNKTVWLIMGYVKNYKPVLISTSGGGSYPYIYGLACHVINALPAVYLNGAETAASGNWEFVQKGVSPVNEDDALGSAYMRATGPYTGALRRGNWLIEIYSIAAGSEVGLATFRWSMDGGETWLGEDMLTWKLACDETTRWPKSPAVGNATMALSGEYTGITNDIYKVKITRGGHIGDVPCPQFIWSNNDGLSWSDPVDILDDEDIALDRGLSVAFTGAAGSGTWNEASWWTPIAMAPGVMSVVAHNHGDNVDVEITTAGNVGDLVRFKWRNNGGAWDTDNPIPDTSPIELFAGYSVQFTAPGIESVPDYDVYDAGGSTSVYVAPFQVDDAWAWHFRETPIPLADGVSVQFFTQSGQDFYAGDKFTFILMSQLYLRAVGETTEINVDAEGLESPVTDVYTDLIGEMIRAGAILLLDWSPEDFDAPAMTAFNAAFPYQAGLGVESPTEFGEIVKRLLGGIPAIHSMTLDGKFRLAELTPSEGTPVLVINDTNLQGRPQHGNSEEDRKIYRRVYLTYDRNYDQNSQPSGVTQERLEWVKNETRSISARDDAVRQIFSLASDLGPLDTCLIKREDALAVAQKDLLLFKEEWDPVKVDLKTQPYAREIGETAELRRAKFGLDEGKLFKILGLDLDFTANKSTLDLWG